MRVSFAALMLSTLAASPVRADGVLTLFENQMTLVAAISDDEAAFKERLSGLSPGFDELLPAHRETPGDFAPGDWDVSVVWIGTQFGEMTLSCTRLGPEILEAASGPKLQDEQALSVLAGRRPRTLLIVISPDAGNGFPKGAVRSLECGSSVNGAGLAVPELTALRAVLSSRFDSIEESAFAVRNAPNRSYFACNGGLRENIWLYGYTVSFIYLDGLGPDTLAFIDFGFVAFEMALSG